MINRKASKIRCRTRVLSLFHPVKEIRCQAALQLLKEAFGDQSILGLSNNISALDPFLVLSPTTYTNVSPNNAVTINEWKSHVACVTTSVQKNNLEKDIITLKCVGNFSHSDAKNVASIAFGQNVEDDLRGTALRQLVDALESDSLLLETAEVSWCLWLTEMSLARLNRSTDTQGIPLALAKLLYILVGRLMVVRMSLGLLHVTDSSADAPVPPLNTTCDEDISCIDIRPLLRIVLHDRDNRNISIETKGLCCEVLWRWVVAVEAWSNPSQSQQTQKSEWKIISIDKHEVPVPAFLSAHVLAVHRPKLDKTEGFTLVFNIPISVSIWSPAILTNKLKSNNQALYCSNGDFVLKDKLYSEALSLVDARDSERKDR